VIVDWCLPPVLHIRVLITLLSLFLDLAVVKAYPASRVCDWQVSNSGLKNQSTPSGGRDNGVIEARIEGEVKADTAKEG